MATEAKFQLGRTVATAGAVADLTPLELTAMLVMHHNGNWGDVCEADKRANEYALKDGARLLSRYDANGRSYYVITEWDRSVTTIMRVEDY